MIGNCGLLVENKKDDRENRLYLSFLIGWLSDWAR